MESTPAINSQDELIHLVNSLNSNDTATRDLATKTLDAAAYSQNQASLIDWMITVISTPGFDADTQTSCVVYLKNKFGRNNYSVANEQAFRAGQAHIERLLTQGNYIQLISSLNNKRVSEHISILMGNIIKSNINQFCKENKENDADQTFNIIN